MLGKSGFDNEKLLQCLIISMIEDNGMTIPEVIKLLNMTAIKITQGLMNESRKIKERSA